MVSLSRLQEAFDLISLLQLSGYFFPQQAVVKDKAQFDFVIVGGGTAGCIIANRLTKNPDVTVLLIEAGEDPPIQSLYAPLKDYLRKSRFDWNDKSENDGFSEQCSANKAQVMISGKMLGGSSSINSMIYTRGYTHDFDTWAEISGDSSWNWEGVYPYFLKSERMVDPIILSSDDRYHHGTMGYLGTKRYYHDQTPVTNYFQSFEELGYDIVLDITRNNTLGVSEPIFTLADHVRQSTAISFFTPIKNRTNLFVLKETFVTKVLINSNNEAYGVEVLTKGNKILTLLANREVVVSAGALYSPKLLMLSGIGPKEHLESHNIETKSDLPVGHNFLNHLSVILTYKMGAATKSTPSDPREVGSPTIIGYFTLNKNQSYPDYETYCNVFNNADNFESFCRINAEFNRRICKTMTDSLAGSSIFYITITNLQPNSSGIVSLHSSNPLDPPRVVTGYYSGKGDVEKHIKLIREVRAIENTTYFKKTNAKLIDPTECWVFEFNSDEYWRCYILCLMVPDHHYAGTCAMGSVVDSRLLVYNIKKLRVADASIIPRLTRCHTYAPTMMIAEKFSDMIKEDHGL